MGARDKLRMANQQNQASTMNAVDQTLNSINNATPVVEVVKEEPKAVVEKPKVEIAPKKAPAAKKTKAKSNVSDLSCNDCVRQTYYITYEQMEALKELAHVERIPVNNLMREILQDGLERRKPGILESVKDYADAERAKRSK